MYISFCFYESQPHKGQLTFRLKYRRFPSYLLCTLLLYFLFIFCLFRCTLPNFPSVTSLASLPFLPCCHRTTTNVRYEVLVCIMTSTYQHVMIHINICIMTCSNGPTHILRHLIKIGSIIRRL